MSRFQDNQPLISTGHEIIEIAKVVAYLQQRGDIKQAILFDFLAIGRVCPESDIDLAIEKKCPLSTEEKTELIKKNPLLTACSVDHIDLKTVGESFLG